MTWSKPGPTETARADNKDLRIQFYYGDSGANPPNSLRVALDVDIDRPDAGKETRTVDVAMSDVSALTGAEKTQLGALLVKLRDAGLAALGFVQS